MSALKIFFGSGVPRWRQALIMVCLLAAGLAEGFGLATILPVLTVAGGENLGPQQPEFAIRMIVFISSIGLPVTFTGLLIVMIGGMLAREILSFLAMSFVGYTIARLSTSYRRRLIDAYLKANWAYFTKEPLGQLTYAVSSFAAGAADAFLVSSRLIANVMRTTVYLAVIVIISGKLALIALAAGAMIVAALHFLVNIARKAGRKEALTSQLLSVNLTDTFASIKPLKAMARQEHVHIVFNRTIKRLRKHIRRAVISSQGLINLQGLLETIAIGAGLYVAVVYWRVPLIELGVMGGLMLHITKSIGRSQRIMQRVAANEISYWRLREIIGEADAAREENSGTVKPALDAGIALESVSFSFGSKRILEDAGAEIPANRLTVIHGPSGQGKTTLTDLILGLYKPENGRILIDGVPLCDVDLRDWRSGVGYVPQELILHNGTIKMNITLGDPSFSDEEVWEALRIADGEAFVLELDKGINAEIGEQGLKLSGGQRQRISLARALVHKPRLIILDEVTSALDPATETSICRRIHELAADRTIIAITHRPAWLEVADMVLEISDHGITSKVTDRAVA